MATPQAAIFNEMGRNQWYVHMSRVDAADLGVIKSAIRTAIADAEAEDLSSMVS